MISLKALRTDSGLTLDEAAKKLGISKFTLYNYEHFKTQPSKEKIDKILELYGVHYDDIRFLPKENEKPDKKNKKWYVGKHIELVFFWGFITI